MTVRAGGTGFEVEPAHIPSPGAKLRQGVVLWVRFRYVGHATTLYVIAWVARALFGGR